MFDLVILYCIDLICHCVFIFMFNNNLKEIPLSEFKKITLVNVCYISSFELLTLLTCSFLQFYCQNHVVPTLPVACCPVVPGEERPPVERNKNILPNWLLVQN